MNKKKSFSILLTIILIMMSLFPSFVMAESGSALKKDKPSPLKNTEDLKTERGSSRPIPQLSPAQPGTLKKCEALLSFDFKNTKITKAELVPEGALSNGGKPVGQHCLIQGKMNERVSPVDGQTYAIGFEMRLPVDWAGRFLYQANGGLDGVVASALGSITGGQLNNGLQMGFAVMSSDAGHNGAQNPLFGLDPQARLDYGYQAVGTLTPMAKSLIKAAYGREPDRSYFAGGSNGGRHTMVAASRYADQYDGFLAVAPGFNLPKAAVAQLWGAQQWAKVATTTDNLETALPPAERQVLAQAILARCDSLDRLVDGMVQDSNRCQKVFDVQRDVPTCDTVRDGTCLTEEQKHVVQDVFAGAKTSSGKELYSSFPFDPGIVQGGWAEWKFRSSVGPRDPVAVGFIFSTPPVDKSMLKDTLGYALNFNVDTQAGVIYKSNELYTESAMEFMTPPNPTNLDTMRNSGAKMIVVHGAADGVFSPADTARWYENLDANYQNKAEEFVRYFEVPGMGHVRGGPATDQFDGLGALIKWVENGSAPDRIIATARGEGNPGGVNPDVPSTWAPDRSRPLCPYPLVARYTKGDPEVASSFQCKPSSGGSGLNQ
ncbi:tannase/feruloyl esterase family alpha/beta hydrolase [Neobacillus drentensis]|uniref:tannase/feruloyl esterase family alpha/beta hydrolase n=1 Tax=Neobacillus drentensis TaxID=220684 RepID=UPI001F2105B1|nr:tannase/feruloyl esterase family alpha/beta hydrolase [Neobacillus drentensis]ULT58841.1 tannase/feruloyl esterase family alpha/beta hydrolase [Neobacillus drentensis]